MHAVFPGHARLPGWCLDLRLARQLWIGLRLGGWPVLRFEFILWPGLWLGTWPVAGSWQLWGL